LRKHAPWDSAVARLVYVVAPLDPAAALRIAKSKAAPEHQASALIAVARGMTVSAEMEEGAVR